MSVVDFPPKKLHLIFYRLTRDPYEHTRVYVSQSRIPYAGEGLFAKQRVEAGSLLAIFNGVRIRDNSRAASTRNKKKDKNTIITTFGAIAKRSQGLCKGLGGSSQGLCKHLRA